MQSSYVAMSDLPLSVLSNHHMPTDPDAATIALFLLCFLVFVCSIHH